MAGYTGSIAITGFIAPTDINDTYPVTDSLFGIDGLRNVGTTASMFAIPNDRRRQGMVVGVNNINSYFKLRAAPWNGTIADWDDFITIPNSGNVTRTQHLIINGTVSIPTNYQYFVYGDLTIGTSGSLVNDGQVIIMNGSLATVSTGIYSGVGTLTYINNILPKLKYSASFSCSASVPITVTHSLSTTDFTYTVREGNNIINVNLEIAGSSSVILTSNNAITNGRINIQA